MDEWERDAIDLVGPGFIQFDEDATGEFGFVAVRGWMDCRSAPPRSQADVEFSWEGVDEGDQVSGRGWAAIADGRLHGHLYIHLGEDSTFEARPWNEVDQQDGEARSELQP